MVVVRGWFTAPPVVAGLFAIPGSLSRGRLPGSSASQPVPGSLGNSTAWVREVRRLVIPAVWVRARIDPSVHQQGGSQRLQWQWRVRGRSMPVASCIPKLFPIRPLLCTCAVLAATTAVLYVVVQPFACGPGTQQNGSFRVWFLVSLGGRAVVAWLLLMAILAGHTNMSPGSCMNPARELDPIPPRPV